MASDHADTLETSQPNQAKDSMLLQASLNMPVREATSTADRTSW